MSTALTEARIARILLLAVFMNLLFGTGFYFAERGVQEGLTWTDSIWWAMVTMTTVGYGDYYAQTFVGRFFISYPSFIFGIGLLGFLLGSLVEVMMERVAKKRKGLMNIRKKKHIIICNYPSEEKITHLVEELRSSGSYTDNPVVLVTDHLKELPEVLRHLKVEFVYGNPIKEEVLNKANITECEGVFVLSREPGNPETDAVTFACSAIIEMIEKEIGKSIKVVAELVSNQNQKMMKRADTDGIVSSDGVSDCLLVQEFLYPGIQEIFSQIISNKVGSQFYISQTRLKGSKVFDIQVAILNHPINLQVIGIIHEGQYILNPPKTLVISENDRLIMLAESITDFEKIEEEIINKKTA